MTLSEILDYYAGLLIIQYKNKTKAKATVKLMVNQSICDDLVQIEETCFDLDTAIGIQLEILGKIVGVERDIYGLDLGHTYFNFTRYIGSPASDGFGRYADYPEEELFYRYNNYAIYSLTDFELRSLIYLKIIFNNKYSSFKNLKESIYAKFSNDIDLAESPLGIDTSDFLFWNFTRYVGSPDSLGFGRYDDSPYMDEFYRYAYFGLMQLTYTVKDPYHNAFAAGVFLDIVPKPMGVQVNAVYS
jgi:hypothetical protein